MNFNRSIVLGTVLLWWPCIGQAQPNNELQESDALAATLLSPALPLSGPVPRPDPIPRSGPVPRSGPRGLAVT
jgi:hypothetical protein